MWAQLVRRRGQRRALSSAAFPPLFELSRDLVKPEHLFEHCHSMVQQNDKEVFANRTSFRVHIGQTSSVYHLERFADYDARCAALRLRDEAAYEDDMARSEDEAMEAIVQGEFLVRTENSIFVEATAALRAAGVDGLASAAAALAEVDSDTVYELRTYQLVLGYAAVPNFLALYSEGLADKLATDDSGASQLVTLLHSEAGASPLNTVIELWRHTSMQGSQRSRAASRGATKWRAAISKIADMATRFDTQLIGAIY
ncbi:hypothetical protein M885DRAFT_550064 [Pelagophyceae sp. CCMP2097]|nr:hypothetical protein M885DRAFT_550064 [Pelagophyceae sp. CCMP2097]